MEYTKTMSDLQEKASALLARIDEDQQAERNARLSPSDRAMILRLAAKGRLAQDEIAHAVGCSQPTVSGVLALLDTRQEARTILESGAAKMAQTVVDTDDAAIALKALGKLDVVREDTHAGANTNVLLVVGQPGQPTPPELEPPFIEAVLSSGGDAV